MSVSLLLVELVDQHNENRSEDNLNTRNTATSKLRTWLGKNLDGEDYLLMRADDIYAVVE